MDTFGAFFGPLFGIMVVDYYLVKKTNLDNKDIFSLERIVYIFILMVGI